MALPLSVAHQRTTISFLDRLKKTGMYLDNAIASQSFETQEYLRSDTVTMDVPPREPVAQEPGTLIL